MGYNTPTDHTASVVTVNEWNAQLGAAGSVAYLKAATDAPMKAQKDAGTVVGGRGKINFISGSNIVLTVADNSGNDRIDVTIAASGGTTPTQSQAARVQVTAGPDLWTPGAWAESIPSTSFAATMIILSAYSGTYGISIDIGTGTGGAETLKVSGIGSGVGPVFLCFPFSIAQSTRVALRAGCTQAGATVYTAITLLG